jgi:hypothetical protein
MAELYKHFAKEWEHCLDFSDEALLEMYQSETHGIRASENNGYYHGKKWLNLTVTMWKEDIKKGFLFRQELYRDGKYPSWWLDRILGP